MEMPILGNLSYRNTAYCLFSAENCVEREKGTFAFIAEAREGPKAGYSTSLK